MLRFLVHREFNRFDLFWVVTATLSANEGRYWLAFVVCVVGALVSVALE